MEKEKELERSKWMQVIKEQDEEELKKRELEEQAEKIA